MSHSHSFRRPPVPDPDDGPDRSTSEVDASDVHVSDVRASDTLASDGSPFDAGAEVLAQDRLDPFGDDLLAQPLDDDLDERIAKAAPRRLANRATFVLAALALVVVGFVAGAQVQKSYGTAPAATTPGGANPAALASAFAGRNGGAQVPGGTGSQSATRSGGGITGTVKLVDGTTVYVETADGTTLIVKTSGTTTVSAPSALKDLTAGSTVTVVGPNADGTVTATSITKTK